MVKEKVYIWPHGPEEYRGKAIEDIDSRFLKWIAENAFDDELAEAADKEWRFRERFNTHIE